MARIVIEYNPSISEETKKLIKDNVTPSMISNDEENSCQYEISVVADLIESQVEMTNVKDLLFINELINDGVSFIEF